MPQAPPPKDVTVKLPAGVSISAGASDGLQGCSDLASDPAGDQIHYDTTKPVTCPDASIIGTATANSPLLASRDPVDDSVTGPDPLPGSIYLIKPHPGDLSKSQDGTFRVLIELNSNRYGVNFKLPGTVTADKETGQLTTVFLANPQLPASQLKLNFKSRPAGAAGDAVDLRHLHLDQQHGPVELARNPRRVAVLELHDQPGRRRSALCQHTRGAPLQPHPQRRHPVDGGRPVKPLHPARRPQGRRTGVQLPRRRRSQGIHRLAQGRLLLRRGRRSRPRPTGAAPPSRRAPSCPASSRIGTLTAAAGTGTNPFYSTATAYLAGPVQRRSRSRPC